MDITFVRHGATLWNHERRFQGQTGIPLSDEGRAQATALANAFLGERFDRIVSSDLVRAYDTALAIAGTQDVVRDPRWRELAFGRWEGLRVDEVAPGVNARSYAPPGGETFAAMRTRVAGAIEELRRAPDRRVLVVTHSGALHAMLDYLFGEVPVRFEPACITQVQLEPDGAKLLSVGISVRQYAADKHGRRPGQI